MSEISEVTPKTFKELPLAKLKFADNTDEINDLAQAGFAFSGSSPKRVDMVPHNKLAFLSNALLRQEFEIDRQDLLSPFRRKGNAFYEPTVDIYVDFLKKRCKEKQMRTHYHELGHAYIQRQNPDLHQFLKEMNEKMCGRKYPESLSKKHWKKISEDQKKQYLAFKTVDEGVARYIAVEAEAIKAGYSETKNACLYHDDTRQQAAIVLDGNPISQAHIHGYRNVILVCKELRKTGLSAKEAIDLIIQNPPNNPNYFFWHHDKYAKSLLELHHKR